MNVTAQILGDPLYERSALAMTRGEAVLPDLDQPPPVFRLTRVHRLSEADKTAIIEAFKDGRSTTYCTQFGPCTETVAIRVVRESKARRRRVSPGHCAEIAALYLTGKTIAQTAKALGFERNVVVGVIRQTCGLRK